jgi:hypothetical protein
MSDTPISDSTPHNVGDLGMLCRRLERELNSDQNRIKQLEDRIHRAASAFFRDGSDGHIASQMLQILEEERGQK